MFDLLIENGLIVDGEGGTPYRGDIGVSQGLIAEMGELSGAAARRTIDASDLVVSPGFIDPHTHYDAQICWDSLATPSAWHGVTSVILGNCGVGIAPCKPDDLSREIATRDLVTVEQIDYDVLTGGVSWDWTTFPEYMDAAERRGNGLNIGFIAPLTPFRHFVMGEESIDRTATPEETAQIKQLLKEAVSAGAMGFSTTYMPNHIGYRGMPLAAQKADHAELAAYCHGLRELNKGIVEIALATASVVNDKVLGLLDLVVAESERPVTWLSLLDRDGQPEICRDALEITDTYAQRGAKAQVSARPLMVIIDMYDRPGVNGIMSGIPSWASLRGRSREDIVAAYSDPAFREAFRSDLATPRMFAGRWEGAAIQRAGPPALQKLAGVDITEIARQRGKDPLDTFFDLAVEADLELVYSYEAFNTDVEHVPNLLNDPRTLIGLADGGAHLEQLCDAGYCTYLLGYWVREQNAMPLEYAVKRMTSEVADFFGIRDRGRLATGTAADITIFDPTTVGSDRRPSETRRDLPRGGRRLLSHSRGIEHTIVNGVPLFEAGRHSGWLPGKVLRSA